MNGEKLFREVNEEINMDTFSFRDLLHYLADRNYINYDLTANH